MSPNERPDKRPRSVPWPHRGLPELELFESTAQRDIAIERLDAESRDFSRWDARIALLTVIAMVLLADAVAEHVSHAIGASRGQKLIVFVILYAPAAVILLKIDRRRSAKSLREQLLAVGIPVCRGCGYCLRGLPPDSSCCPECARPLDAGAAKLLTK